MARDFALPGRSPVRGVNLRVSTPLHICMTLASPMPTLLVSPVLGTLFFAYLGRSAGVRDDAFYVVGNGILAIAGPCVFGGVMAGLDAASLESLQKAGTSIGVAYQICDDIQDFTDPGQGAGSDATKAKATYPGLFGLDRARARSGQLLAPVTVRIAGAKGSEVRTFGAASTLDSIATAINLVSDSTGVSARVASGTTTDDLILTSTDYGSDSFVDVQSIGGTAFSTYNSAGSASSREVGSDVTVRVNGVNATAKGLDASINTSTLDLSFRVSSRLTDGDSITFTPYDNVSGEFIAFALPDAGR